jgi:hypothetical protein
VRRHRGVIIKVIIRRLRAQSPVVWMIFSTGFAPSPDVNERKSSHDAGVADPMKKRIRKISGNLTSGPLSEVLPEVHACVHVSYLLCISVE